MKKIFAAIFEKKKLATHVKDWLLKFVSLLFLAIVLWHLVAARTELKNVMVPIEINLPRISGISNQFKKEIEEQSSGPRSPIFVMQLCGDSPGRFVDGDSGYNGHRKYYVSP